ncbi:glycerophosphodiester phosphodiesterase [Rubrobacter xylanophilus]|uniref:glycerophosphodiester phosphodiesterase n=1 Tax=Rubrobacter xylanophilus TaxID=49319 RepID=UPI001F229A4F|nr:glycerophosphodiester phosphodiesterase [Rubrobacter xylanophilus]
MYGATSRRVALSALVAATVAAAILLVAGPAGAKEPEDVVLNVGHRGASGYAPEHTFAAYDLALRMGADYIEQDLQMTRDGVLVVLHDETLDRTARPTAESEPGDCTGLVREKTLAQIKTCDVGSWFNEAYPQYARPEYVGLKIPTLEEVFQRYRKSVNYYIETKSPEAAPGMEEELLRLMDEYGLRRPAAERWQVLIQSFSPASLQKVHALDPSLPLIQLFTGAETSETIRARLDATATYAVGIGPSKDDVDAALVGAAHARCLDVHPYTVNESAEMEGLIATGVDGMFTNFPDRLDAVLGESAIDGRKRAATLAERANDACRGEEERGRTASNGT